MSLKHTDFLTNNAGAHAWSDTWAYLDNSIFKEMSVHNILVENNHKAQTI